MIFCTSLSFLSPSNSIKKVEIPFTICDLILFRFIFAFLKSFKKLIKLPCVFGSLTIIEVLVLSFLSFSNLLMIKNLVLLSFLSSIDSNKTGILWVFAASFEQIAALFDVWAASLAAFVVESTYSYFTSFKW